MSSLPFTIGREDILRGKTVEPGWYKMKVTKIEQEPAKTDGSTNTVISLIILEGKFKDVPLERVFNEKAPGFAINFIKAVSGKDVGEDGGTFNLAGGVGREIHGYVKNEMYQNRSTNKVEDFKPV